MTHKHRHHLSLGASDAGSIACATCQKPIIGGIFYCAGCHMKKENKALGRAKTQIAYIQEQLKQARELLHNKQSKINELQHILDRMEDQKE